MKWEERRCDKMWQDNIMKNWIKLFSKYYDEKLKCTVQ